MTLVIKTAATRHQEAMDDLREVRNARLAACDWTQLPDTPFDAVAWAEYRQALRDLPENTTDPSNPEWPNEPS